MVWFFSDTFIWRAEEGLHSGRERGQPVKPVCQGLYLPIVSSELVERNLHMFESVHEGADIVSPKRVIFLPKTQLIWENLCLIGRMRYLFF